MQILPWIFVLTRKGQDLYCSLSNEGKKTDRRIPEDPYLMNYFYHRRGELRSLDNFLKFSVVQKKEDRN